MFGYTITSRFEVFWERHFGWWCSHSWRHHSPLYTLGLFSWSLFIRHTPPSFPEHTKKEFQIVFLEPQSIFFLFLRRKILVPTPPVRGNGDTHSNHNPFQGQTPVFGSNPSLLSPWPFTGSSALPKTSSFTTVSSLGHQI